MLRAHAAIGWRLYDHTAGGCNAQAWLSGGAWRIRWFNRDVSNFGKECHDVGARANTRIGGHRPPIIDEFLIGVTLAEQFIDKGDEISYFLWLKPVERDGEDCDTWPGEQEVQIWSQSAAEFSKNLGRFDINHFSPH